MFAMRVTRGSGKGEWDTSQFSKMEITVASTRICLKISPKHRGRRGRWAKSDKGLA